MNKAAVSFWSVKSPSQDEYGRVWCETYVLKLTNCFSIDLLGRYSAAPLESYKHPYQLVASAGSLAVILQPAFVPFVRAVDYLPLVCLFYAWVVFLCCLKSCLLILELIFRTGIAACGLSFMRVFLCAICFWKCSSVLRCEFVSRFKWCLRIVDACCCAWSSRMWVLLNVRTSKPDAEIHLSAVMVSVVSCLWIWYCCSCLFIHLFSNDQTICNEIWLIVWWFWQNWCCGIKRGCPVVGDETKVCSLLQRKDTEWQH